MKNLCSTLLLFFAIALSYAQQPFGIIIHGGAGSITPERISGEKAKAYEAKLTEARNAGYAVLEQGGKSADAIVAALTVLEDDPLFNAGKGAVLTHEGMPSLDASFMDGKTLNAGAVAGVTRIKNPVKAALLVLEQSRHVLLSGQGADAFAIAKGLEEVDPKYFITPDRLESLKRAKENEKAQGALPYENPDWKYGTVGAVALDKNGNLAAATTTGGMTNKRHGRIGDSPIIGAGTYADNQYAGVSCTGHGEYFIRKAVAYDVIAKMRYAKMPVTEAAKAIIQETADLGGQGGLIVMDKDGNIAAPFSTSGMFRAWKTSKGAESVQMFGEE